MFRSLVIFFSFLSFCLPSNAQTASENTIEEIIVNADYRQSNLDEIPSSLIVIEENLIQKKNAQHLEDILFNAPNVNFSSGASRARG